jgi:hypothetical protein
MPPPNVPPSRATIAIYDRPPWWKRRKTWAIAIPVAASLASLALLVFVL